MTTPFIRDPYRRLSAHFMTSDEDDLSGSDLASCTVEINRILFSSKPGAYEDLFAESRGFPFREEAEREEVAGLLECLGREWWTSEVRIGGYYDHFKGGFYFVEKLIFDTSVKADKYCYQSVYTKKWYGRLPAEWGEIVKWPDGKYRSRFILRGFTVMEPEPRFKVPFKEVE